MKLIQLMFLIPLMLFGSQEENITFHSIDELPITAKAYIVDSKNSPFIILFHQAGWSLGEYKEIAPKLNNLGYNCIAINQRSGGEINGVINETNKLALKENKSTTYIDAYIDMVSALNYVHKKYSPSKLIVWGSSYSAALVFKLASENPNLIDGILSFSPGEYFTKFGKPDSFIKTSASTVNCPVFITSARNEKSKWEKIYDVIRSEKKTYFIPETKGNHGSRALWEEFVDSKSYWKAVKDFLRKYFKVNNK